MAKRTGDIHEFTFHARTKDELKLESTILAKVIEKADHKQHSNLKLIVISVRNAHHPDGKQFVPEVLKKHGGEVAFHAPIGAAELDEPSGVDWLLKNCQLSKTRLDVEIRTRNPNRSGSRS